ncbi:MAG: 50S ribosomal protein L32 [Chitinophagaceae bacterium]|nr:50S ribosomal protein L32 [Chitinophagaceae bacterium]
MANPKRRHSSTRRDKRRTHYKAKEMQFVICPTTKTAHLSHRAFWQDNKLYYKGKVVIDKNKA